MVQVVFDGDSYCRSIETWWSEDQRFRITLAIYKDGSQRFAVWDDNKKKEVVCEDLEL